jgi:rhamnosyltransferase subunit B
VHVILTPVGSSGDVNPFIVVGSELRRRGHRVTLLSPDVFASVTTSAGLEFVSTGTAAEFEETTRNPDLWDPRRGPAVVFGAITKYLRRAYAALDQVYEPGESMLVGHVLSFFARVFEETHPVPAATLDLSPSVLRSDFAQPAMPSGQNLSAWPVWAKRSIWWLIDRFAIDPHIAPALNVWRAEFNLPPVSRVLKSWLHSPQCVIGLFPEWFGEPQPDWPAQFRQTGFVLSDESCAPSGNAAAHDAQLEPFLAAGDPPVVFTPGSANEHAAAFFRAGLDATARIGRRALLVTGYREQLPPVLPAHASHASYASFATLFPRAAAVVHHGGIGTSAQGLAAGVPQLVMAMGFDQPDNGARLQRLGVGRMLTPARFTTDAVASALRVLVSDASVAAACRQYRDRMHESHALAQTCDLLERQFADRRTAG